MNHCGWVSGLQGTDWSLQGDDARSALKPVTPTTALCSSVPKQAAQTRMWRLRRLKRAPSEARSTVKGYIQRAAGEVGRAIGRLKRSGQFGFGL